MAVTRGWKSDEERGPVGAWFVRAIGERSIEQVAKDMADRGHVHAPDYYRGIMSGSKKPGRALLAALVEYLGSAPEQVPSGGDLAAAIREQTEALNRQAAAIERQAEALAALATAIQEARAEQVGANEGLAAVAGRVAQAVEALVGRQA